MRTLEHRVSNGAGWTLSLFQTWDEARLVRGRRPVLIVPGYGMNSFIFSYHPRGTSLEGFLVSKGFEVWRADLRGQGASTPDRGIRRDDYRLEDLGLVDLRVAIETALDRTRTGALRADLVGASLGGTIVLAYAALEPEHRAGAIVAIGTPIRWIKVHPLLRLAFASPTLVGLLRFRGTRKLATAALPRIVRLTPWVLSIYMNPEITDTSAAQELCKTVEDPSRHINREIAEWIWKKDLVVRGRNLSDAIRGITCPLFCVLANADGIVPRPTAEFVYTQVSSESKAMLVVGTDELAMAHADMFVSNAAHERVFEPITDWLLAQDAEDPSSSFGARARDA